MFYFGKVRQLNAIETIFLKIVHKVHTHLNALLSNYVMSNQISAYNCLKSCNLKYILISLNTRDKSETVSG